MAQSALITTYPAPGCLDSYGILVAIGYQLAGQGGKDIAGRDVTQARPQAKRLLGVGGNERRVNAVAR